MFRNDLAWIAGALLIAASAHAAETSGRLEGTITGRDSSTNRLTVAHGEVKGMMGAMTMPYEVRGQKVAMLPKDGTKIIASLHESDGTLWLTDVKAADAPPAHDQTMSGMPRPIHPEPAGMPHGAMETSDLLMRQASGTSMNPAAAPMHMTMTKQGEWTLMLHGLAFVSQAVQSGPRGGDKLFST
ncbi:MAG TPA: copper-binding protein, partial [Thermoanaerobaculia bacterium]